MHRGRTGAGESGSRETGEEAGGVTQGHGDKACS